MPNSVKTLPTGWKLVKVKEVIKTSFSGPSPDCEERPISDDKEWGVLKTNAITWEDGWDYSKHKVLPKSFWGLQKFQVSNDDVIITKAGPRHRCGVVACVTKTIPNLISSGKMITLRPDQKKCDPRFLACSLSTPTVQQYLDSRTSGMAESQENFTNEVLLNTFILYPPIPEQKKISEFITILDKTIDATDQMIQKCQRIKQGLMQDLFHFGIDERGNLRSEETHPFKDSLLGRIPENWDCLQLGEIYSELRTGSTPSRTRPDYFTGDILWVTSGELKYEVVFDSREKITADAVKNTNLKIYPAGTFAIAIIGLEAESTRGSCAILGKDATINQSCVAFPENQRIHTWFLYQYYRNYGKHVVYSYARGTKQQNLNTEIIKSIPIKMPKKTEQIKIAEVLNAADSIIKIYQNEKAKLQRINNGLIDDLLSGKVRVNRLIQAEA